MVNTYLPTSVPKVLCPECGHWNTDWNGEESRYECFNCGRRWQSPRLQCSVHRAARKMCINRLLRKMRKFGKVMVAVTVVMTDDFTERAAVDEAIREERHK